MTNVRLGRVQLRIMQVLWERGGSNARDITDALNAAGPPIAHSTVQTLLRKLEDKKVIGHRLEHRTFVYFPLVDQSSATRSATKDLIDRVFRGSAAGLVAYLLTEEQIPVPELLELRKLINGDDVR